MLLAHRDVDDYRLKTNVECIFTFNFLLFASINCMRVKHITQRASNVSCTSIQCLKPNGDLQVELCSWVFADRSRSFSNGG